MAEPTALTPAPSQAIQVDLRSIWEGDEQTYLSYDGIELKYSIKVLEALLGSGYAGAPTSEKAAFLAYCKSNQLDPIRGQVYFIKYGRDDPAGFVTNWEVFLDRAQRCPQFNGFSCGIIWLLGTAKRTKIVRARPVEYVQDATHKVIGGWATVFRKDQEHPREVEIPLDEMMAKKRDGSPTKFWRSMLTTMATKTPAARALRQSFPETLSGLYTEGEAGAFMPAAEPRLEAGDTLPAKDLNDVADTLEGNLGSLTVPPDELPEHVQAVLQKEQTDEDRRSSVLPADR